MFFLKNIKHAFILTSISVLLLGCGKPNIESNCSSNGFGQVNCNFHNTGKADGSVCVKLKLSAIGGSYNSVYPNGITSSEICSGIVKVDDVVQRSQYGGFEMSPMDYCKIPGNDSWSSGCTLTTDPSI